MKIGNDKTCMGYTIFWSMLMMFIYWTET